ncbi:MULTISPECIES: hypothetical protein [unclassified Priestia]|uniref:hypothetical protein n=1 Tax=unclassified Priestia TaxID=2800374 RepID=UPI00366FE8DD
MDIKQDTINAEEMAKRLNTTSSNIRKWCIELEKQGYEFVKDTRRKRYYSSTDQTLLSNLKYAIQEKKLPLEIAAMTVVKGFDRKRSSSSTQEEHIINKENNLDLTVPQEHNNHTADAVLNTIKVQFEQQQSINNKLLEMLDHYKDALKISKDERKIEQEQMNKQLKELEERLTKEISQQINNRDKAIMDYIRQSQKQNQQQLLEIATAKEGKPKGFFTRLFSK